MHKQDVLASFQTNDSRRINNSIGALQSFDDRVGAQGNPFTAPF